MIEEQPRDIAGGAMGVRSSPVEPTTALWCAPADRRARAAAVDRFAAERGGQELMADGIGRDPVVTEVIRFEDLPVGSTGSRRAIVCWSDGARGEDLCWYHDEVLICEGDLIGKTEAELRRRTSIGTATSCGRSGRPV